MKSTIISILIAICIIGGAALLVRGGHSGTNAPLNANNVSVVGGKQIIEIRAKGGYEPSENIAKAGMPTILRFTTSGTFDCSASVRIPSMDIAKNLPQSGTTDIDLGLAPSGTLQGTCGMGMYPFEIDFKE